jgi:tRNA (uracil-5-)-methyltransferase TRM9
MNDTQIQKIIKENQEFYDVIGEDYNLRKQGSRPGWSEVGDLLENSLGKKESFSVLDIGCGNGRFFEFLQQRFPKHKIDYVGLDTNKTLSTKARKLAVLGKNTAQIKFLDIFNDLDAVEQKFDLAVGFGVTHHIPGESFREKWFAKAANLINKDSFLIFTFWDFLYKNPEPVENLEEGDYYLGWDDKQVQRYCHFFSHQELSRINDVVCEKGFKKVKVFRNDGKDRIKNLYYVFQRRS